MGPSEGPGYAYCGKKKGMMMMSRRRRIVGVHEKYWRVPHEKYWRVPHEEYWRVPHEKTKAQHQINMIMKQGRQKYKDNKNIQGYTRPCVTSSHPHHTIIPP